MIARAHDKTVDVCVRHSITRPAVYLPEYVVENAVNERICLIFQ